MDVELEEMEEGVVDEGDCAVDFALVAVVELEGFAGFVAGWEGGPFEVVGGVFEVFACFSGRGGVRCLFVSCAWWGLRAAVHAFYWYAFAVEVGWEEGLVVLG